jgi:hypothetical protein
MQKQQKREASGASIEAGETAKKQQGSEVDCLVHSSAVNAPLA